ncbi:MAG: WHG domain-containing protein [Congregibacter sp.]|nr:WHG domain-containing protein [Congregibacter sp.]MDP5071175.1 WHG domain-containing protein [Congregibacter sp.]
MTNKQRILEAASQMLLEKGIEGLSVRAISHKAGLSTIAIYSHFKGKQGVLDSLYIEGFGLVRDAMESVAHINDPAQAVIAGSEKYLDIARDNEGHYRLIFGETGSSYQPSDDAAKASKEAFSTLVRGVARLLPPRASEAARQRAALRIWAVLHGYVSLRHHLIGPVLDYAQWHAMAMDAVSSSVKQIADKS